MCDVLPAYDALELIELLDWGFVGVHSSQFKST